MMTKRHVVVAAVVSTLIAACAQLEGLDGFEKVDCTDDCADSGNVVPPNPPPPPVVFDAGQDVQTCPPCTGGTICDPASFKCVECLPGKLDCAVGQFCDPDPVAAFHCVQGCGVVEDCIRASDAGADAADGGDAGAKFANLACCNKRCIDTSVSSAHCGMCGNQCGVGSACCNSTCTDITSNKDDCGGCGNVCSTNHVSSPTCTLGKCSGACDTGFDDCNNDKLKDGCESDIFGDPTKCGACNKSCSTNHVTTPACSAGSCSGACDVGWTDCDNNKLVNGCEIQLDNNPDHCGACPNVCSNNNMASRTCATSTCNGACNVGFKDCNTNKLSDGCEINVTNNPDNCGNCGQACSGNNMATRTCAANVCNGNCTINFGDCDNNKLTNGCEVNFQTDPAHCGACLNKVCSNNHIATPTCAGATCNGTCDPGWDDCNINKLVDGCESLVGFETTHCTNAAGNAPGCTGCPAGARNCVNGVCSAGLGQTLPFPPPAFLDACALGGAAILANTDDTATGLLALPFTFTFDGVAQTQYWLSSNGVMGSGGTPDASCCSFGCIPAPAPNTAGGNPHPALWIYANDMATRTGVCTFTAGAAPNRKLIATWKDATTFNDSSFNSGPNVLHLTFSVVLDEATKLIWFQYGTMTGDDGADAIIGVQSDTHGTQYECRGAPNTNRVASGTTIQFVP